MVEIHLVGIGVAQLPIDLRLSPPCGIIMAGLAGALDQTLKVGDVVIDDCPEGLRPRVAFRSGKILASETIVSTPREKRSLFDKTGALAVDMESAIIRALAADLDVPFVSIRAISDTADESLDPAVLGMIDVFGQVRPIRLASTLVRRPGLIPRLIHLGKSSRLAAKNLAAAVDDIANQWSAIELAPTGEQARTFATDF